jgi:SIR2-like domain
MTKYVLLVGAGFSANWDAPLAAEVRGSLLTDLHDDPALSRALNNGQFEEAFAQFQRATDPEGIKRRERFQAAIISLFGRINSSFSPQNFEWLDNGLLIANQSVMDFLVRFDTIFSLNQDLLLEIYYQPSMPLGKRWDAIVFPGMTPRYPPGVDPIEGPAKLIWRPNDDVRVSPRSQSIYKLHGSSNWLDGGGSPVLIIGSGKADLIDKNPLLKAYHAEFVARLAQPDTKLMVIGYSFSDEHINEVIANAYRAHGLRIHLVDPKGKAILPDPAYANASIKPKRDVEDIILVGETLQPLSSFMGRNTFPYREFMRFFE